MKTLTTILITFAMSKAYASGTFAYVDNDSDIPVKTKVKAVKPAPEPIKEAVEPDPLKDWKPDELDQFDAFLVEKGESREHARQREIAQKNLKRTSNMVNRIAEEDDDLRAPSTVKKSKKKLKSKKKSS